MHHLVQNFIIIRGEREVYEEMVPNLTCSPPSNTSFVVAPLICYRIQKGSGSGVLFSRFICYALRPECIRKKLNQLDTSYLIYIIYFLLALVRDFKHRVT